MVRFNAVGELGLSFYENTLAVAMVDPGSQASASSSVEVGMLLTAVQVKCSSSLATTVIHRHRS